MPVTLVDVAALAGTSSSTASRVFSDPDKVHPETRQRVLDAAKQLHYVPNAAARSLATGRARVVGLIVPDIANPFFAALVKAVANRARRKGFAVFVGDTEQMASEEYEIALNMAGQVAGLLLMAPRLGPERLAEVARRVPTVLLNGDASGVLATSQDGVREAVLHLHALGHRRCAWVSGPAASWSNQHRKAAMRETCDSLGIELVEFGPFESAFSSGVLAADLIRASGVTSVVAHNDVVALGLLSRFAQQGVAVPGDVSVVGIDDTPMAAAANPALTTVRVPVQQMGAEAVDLLIDMLESSAQTRPVIELPSTLIVRASTDRAPGRDRKEH